jgi:23S rRNA-/tRNA-specific pseudouridylate synthase
MESKRVEADGTLLEFLMENAGYATRTRARTAVKAGAVAVDGNVLRIPSSDLKAGAMVSWTALSKQSVSKDFDLGGASSKNSAKAKEEKPPYEVVYENDYILAYIKPAGMVFASPKPQVKTSYTRMKQWLESNRSNLNAVQFVNRIEKESSGVCIIAKDLRWRKHLQDNWDHFTKRMYVIVQGHLPADDVLFCYLKDDDGKRKDKYEFEYRTMRATSAHTLLKMTLGFDQIPVLMSGLRRLECYLIGKGKEVPDPMGRSGLHLFGVDIEGPDGEKIAIKSRVPQDFLNLMKGGKGPKAVPAWKRAIHKNEEQPAKSQRRSSQSRR